MKWGRTKNNGPAIKKYKYCRSCGDLISGGERNFAHARCSKCFQTNDKNKYCASCGCELPVYTKRSKYTTFKTARGYIKCRECHIKEIDPSNISSIAETDLEILGECSCSYHRTKHRHHPDYSKPLQVFKMCARCHVTEHLIIKYCEMNGVYDSPKHSTASLISIKAT